MPDVKYDDNFLKEYGKIRDKGLQLKVDAQISKIIATPSTGKPMKYARKGTREVYMKSFRISYAFFE